jgi:hypothetical protein
MIRAQVIYFVSELPAAPIFNCLNRLYYQFLFILDTLVSTNVSVSVILKLAPGSIVTSSETAIRNYRKIEL